MNENVLEQLCLTWFQDSGWEFRHGPDIAPDGDTPERSDYQRSLLPNRVLEALQRLNPQVPQTVLDEVLHRLAKPEQLSLIQNNHTFHDLLLDYLQYFVLFEPAGDTLEKKIAGYHQFHAVREAIRATIIAASLPAKERIDEERPPTASRCNRARDAAIDLVLQQAEKLSED